MHWINLEKMAQVKKPQKQKKQGFSADLLDCSKEGKLCFIAEDDTEESDDGEEADDSETGEVDFSVKTYFEKIIVTE